MPGSAARNQEGAGLTEWNQGQGRVQPQVEADTTRAPGQLPGQHRQRKVEVGEVVPGLGLAVPGALLSGSALPRHHLEEGQEPQPAEMGDNRWKHG